MDETSVVNILLEASLLVKMVMGLLLLLSVISWALIIKKSRELKRRMSGAQSFESRFWSGEEMEQLYRSLLGRQKEVDGLEYIFLSGFKEFRKSYESRGLDSRTALASGQRSMRAAFNRELNEMETNLSFIATVGSTSPYIGLFGTVWGIMNSFIALGGAQQATLQSVAPGIAEALIATAMGLFAAIPAVVAYNKHTSSVDRLVNSYDTFIEEFVGILQREAYTARKVERSS